MITLNFPVIIEGCSKTVTFYPKITKLGDNYQQVVGANMGVRRTEWALTSAWLTTSELNSLVATLKILGGGEPCLINLGEVLGSISFICDEYQVDYGTANRTRLLLRGKETEGGEYLSLANLLPTTNIPTRLTNAINHLTATTSTTDYYAWFVPGHYLVAHKAVRSIRTTDNLIPAHSSTSVSSLKMVKAVLDTYLITGNYAHLTLATNILSSVLVKLYPVPIAPPSSSDWLPHWLYTIKETFNPQAPIAGLVENSGYLSGVDANRNFTLSEGQFYFTTITNLARVFKCGIGTQSLIGRYVFAPRINEALDFVRTVYWIDKNNIKFTVNSDLTVTIGVNDTAFGVGAIMVELPVGYVGTTVRVNHSIYTTTFTAESKFETYPFERALVSGEQNTQTEILGDIIDIYQEMLVIEGGTNYINAYNSTVLSAISAIRLVDNLSYQDFEIFKPEPTGIGGEPFLGFGQGFVLYGDTTATITRSATSGEEGFYKVDVTAYTSLDGVFSEIRLRNSAAYVVWSAETRITVRIKATVRTVIYLYLGLSSAHLWLQADIYLCPFVVEANTWFESTFAYTDFLRYFATASSDTIWHPTRRIIPVTAYGSSGYINSYQLVNTTTTLMSPVGISKKIVALEMSMNRNGGTQAGYAFVISTDELQYLYTVPNFFFKVISGVARIFIKDANLHFFYKDQGVTDWINPLYADYDMNPLVVGTVLNTNQTINSMYIETANNSPCVVQVFNIGNLPTQLPISCTTYDTFIGFRNRSTHTNIVEYLKITKAGNAYLAFTPGVTPPIVSKVGSTKKWVGEPRIECQNLYLATKLGLKTEAANITEFYLQASKHLTQNSGVFQTKGFMSPVYRWDRWAAHPGLPTNVFDSKYQHYPWFNPLNAELQYKAGLDIAKAWYLDKGNVELKNLVENLLEYLNFYWFNFGNTGNAPTKIQVDGYPILSGHNTWGSAIVMQTAIWANLSGGNRLNSILALVWIWQYLESQIETSGSLSGIWSKDKPVTSGSFKDIYAEDVVETMRAYALLHQYKSQLRYPTKSEWDSLPALPS